MLFSTDFFIRARLEVHRAYQLCYCYRSQKAQNEKKLEAPGYISSIRS